jgi:hypothetical protein
VSDLGSGAFRDELLFAGLQTAKAWEMLHDPKVTGHLKTDDYMQLCRDAGYGEDAVQKAGTAWANKRLDAKLEP